MDQRDDFDLPFPMLGEMMQRLGLDPLVALQCEPQAFGLAVQRCQACRCAYCRDWLAPAGTVQAPPVFCPNADLLARLRGRRPPADIGCWL